MAHAKKTKQKEATHATNVTVRRARSAPADVVPARKRLVRHRPLAIDCKRPDHARPYRLEGTQVRLWLTEEKAKDRNSVLNDKTGRWRLDPNAYVDQIKDDPCPNFSWESRRKLAREAALRDEQWYQSLRPRRTQENDMSVKEKEAKSAKSEKKSKKSESTGEGPARQKWHDIGMCALIRLCGKKGYGATKTEKIMHSLKLEPNEATIKIQLRKGRKDEDVPNLPKDAKEEFNEIAGDIPNDEEKKSSKKSDKKKKSKKSDETEKVIKKSKKSKKSDEEAQAEADAEDEDVEEEEEAVDEEEEEEVDA